MEQTLQQSRVESKSPWQIWAGSVISYTGMVFALGVQTRKTSVIED